MKMIAAVMIGIALGTAAFAMPPVGSNIKTVVDGSTFLIRIRKDHVQVTNKALVVVQTVDLRTKMREAVKQATGCELVDEMWSSTALMGSLSCPTEN